MTNTSKNAEPGVRATAAGITVLLVFILGLIAPIVLAALLWLTPNTTLRTGDSGTFVSAGTSAGGLLAPAMTSVQTDTGTITVVGAFSALRGQRVQIRDGMKSGLRLCVVGVPDACADVAGNWTGRLMPVAHRHSATDWIATAVGSAGLAFWFLVGMIATIVAIVALAHVGGWGVSEERVPDKPASDSSAAP